MLQQNQIKWFCDYIYFFLQAGPNTLVISSQNELLDEKQWREDYSSLVNKTCIICAWIKLFGLQCSDLF